MIKYPVKLEENEKFITNWYWGKSDPDLTLCLLTKIFYMIIKDQEERKVEPWTKDDIFWLAFEDGSRNLKSLDTILPGWDKSDNKYGLSQKDIDWLKGDGPEEDEDEEDYEGRGYLVDEAWEVAATWDRDGDVYGE